MPFSLCFPAPWPPFVLLVLLLLPGQPAHHTLLYVVQVSGLLSVYFLSTLQQAQTIP
jgi:hypothetical protein